MKIIILLDWQTESANSVKVARCKRRRSESSELHFFGEMTDNYPIRPGFHAYRTNLLSTMEFTSGGHQSQS